ncbi:MAG: hypothetical protein WCL00_06700, partial [Bacteroidota bacterium]
MFEETISNKIRYILSHVDRDRYSKTYGCCDRLYWGWKLKDFPDATLQRYAYPLAKYFSMKDGLTNDKIDIILSILKYTGTIIHKDGSCDQAYPGEHSHAATAFLLFDVANAYLIIEKKIENADKSSILELLKRMGSYLLKNDEKHGIISNHILGAGAALELLSHIFNKHEYHDKALEYVYRIIKMQNKEGWFNEYGGADPGYQTLGIYYLANFYQYCKDEKVLLSLKNAVDFVSYFIQPDGSFGGEYGSRSTEIFYMGGFALMRNAIPVCNDILNFMLKSSAENKTVTLYDIDQWNLAPLLNNYLLVSNYQVGEEYDLPLNKNFLKEFKESGLIVYSSQNTYMVICVSKGGMIKVFDKMLQELVLNDCGYIGSYQGKTITSQVTSVNSYDLKNNTLVIDCPLYSISQPIPSPYIFVAIRVYSLLFGSYSAVREFL